MNVLNCPVTAFASGRLLSGDSSNGCDRKAVIGQQMADLMLLLLLWLDVTASAAANLQKRVVGGQPCKRLYHVKLRAVAASGSSMLCGGSLISDRWILTAAHCLKQGRTMLADLQTGGSTQTVEIKAEPVIYAERDPNNRIRSHDIMLLQLPAPTHMQPVALPDCDRRPTRVEIAGHAATSGGPKDERRPHESPVHCADVDVVSCDDLSKTLQQRYPLIYRIKMRQHWFCGQTPRFDICFGDSGGGVVYNDKIYGVISFLGDPGYVCRKAAAFMDVCNPGYIRWIRNTTNITSQNM